MAEVAKACNQRMELGPFAKCFQVVGLKMALILLALGSCDLREICSKVWLTRRFDAMRYVVNTMLFTALMLGMGSVVKPSPAIAETYDGNWTVLVITDKAPATAAIATPCALRMARSGITAKNPST